MSSDTKEASHSDLWCGLKTPKCHACCHQTMIDPKLLLFLLFLCAFSYNLGPLQPIHHIQDKHAHHSLPPLFLLPSVSTDSILMGACVCLGTRCYQRAYARLHSLIPCSRLVNMFTCISLRSPDITWGILLPPLWEKKESCDKCDFDGAMV